MFFISWFILLIGLNSLNAETFIKEFQLTKSPDVTRLRVEYFTNDASQSPSSLTYSLWKGQQVVHVSQINQQFGQNFKLTEAANNFLFDGSDSSLQFQIEEDTELYAIVSVTRSSKKAVTMDDCFKLNSQEVSWYGGPQQKYQYWPIDRLNLKDYSYITKEADNCGVAERYWLNSRGIFIYVDAEAPLFLNQAPMESLCLTVEKKLPYYAHDNETISFNYKIGIAADARQAHMMAIDKFLKKPTGYPDERMVRHPIWSTWARYYAPINESVLTTFANEILQYKFNNSQFEIDDAWEICYGATAFDTTKFPNIKELTDSLKLQGFRVTLWIHPFINKDCSPYFEDALINGYLVLDQNGNASTQWWNSQRGEAGYIDFTKPSAATWFSDKLKVLAEDAGIDSFKFDAGESSWAPYDPVLSATPKRHPLAITTDYINTVSKFGAMEEVRSAFRNQEMPIFLRMIDKDSEWNWNNGLPTLVTTLLQLNMVGYPLVLPDMIGGNGYNNRPPNKEMFIRWLQANVFMPSLQFSFVPWDYDAETIAISHTFTDLHAKYTDVIMERFKLASEKGDPVNPPIWWIAPDDRVAQYTNDEFLLGEDILVAPVLVEGMVSRDIYLPRGVWKDENTGDTLTGPTWLYSYPANLSVLPYFTRTGATSSSTSVIQISEISATMIALFALLFLSRF
ncbi:myogenesis-regulating glycosidase-like [Bradysia coprophila]|uniref:myogenesis-regulating glycosidase-like n=1 Tax=Bradysia coprophila TaxID=38358 RepID=UPI00187D9495|nr:myogenesis-regulating glycosidase-like [Bradysia coprophila]